MSGAGRAFLLAVMAALLASCGSAAAETSEAQTAPVAPALSAAATGAATPLPSLSWRGEVTQGGWIRGQAPAGTVSMAFNGQALPLAPDGQFFAAFDRDAGPSALISATLADGRILSEPITVSPRAWNIEHVNVARRPGGASESFMQIRRPELAKIADARSRNSVSDGWKQDFVWPVKGRISGRFGSQRIYRGEPASYHSGIDITTGTSGSTFVAPADGVVVLAAEQPFSLEGHLLMIDHGNGLNSAFLHCSALLVKEGDRVRQGQAIGQIGMSGRATGPHLHWSMKWNDARIDPILFTGPM